MTPRNGFTLIELAITLVIIGLIIGGVLYGRDLIRAAQTRLQVSQIERYNAAAETFRIKYNCLPGDCANASELNLGGDGDGNGQVNGSLQKEEAAYFWYHLSEAGLISGSYPDFADSNFVPGVDTPRLMLPGVGYDNATSPFNAAGGLAIASSGAYTQTAALFGTRATLWYLTATTAAVGTAIGIYKGDDMLALDSKMDDGKPATGIMQGATYVLNDAAPTYTSANIDSCIDDVTLAPDIVYHLNYEPANSKVACAAVIKTPF